MWADWGDVPTWAATVAAAGAALFAGRAWSIERGRDVAALLAQQRQQAELVAIWPDGEVYGAVRASPNETRHGYVQQIAVLVNASALPVYNVVVRQYKLRQSTLLSDAKPHDIEPDGQWEKIVLPPTQAPERNPTGELAEHYRVYAIQFTDAAGREWNRDVRGHLSAGPLPSESRHHP